MPDGLKHVVVLLERELGHEQHHEGKGLPTVHVYPLLQHV